MKIQISHVLVNYKQHHAHCVCCKSVGRGEQGIGIWIWFCPGRPVPSLICPAAALSLKPPFIQPVQDKIVVILLCCSP